MWVVRIFGTDVAVVGAAIVIIRGGRVIRKITTSTQRMRRRRRRRQVRMMDGGSIQDTAVIAGDVVRSSNDLSDQLQPPCLPMMSGIKAKPARCTVRQFIPQAPIRADIDITALDPSHETNLFDTREAMIQLLVKRKTTKATSQAMMIPQGEGTQPTISPSHHLPLQHPMALACPSVLQAVHFSLRTWRDNLNRLQHNVLRRQVQEALMGMKAVRCAIHRFEERRALRDILVGVQSQEVVDGRLSRWIQEIQEIPVTCGTHATAATTVPAARLHPTIVHAMSRVPLPTTTCLQVRHHQVDGTIRHAIREILATEDQAVAG